MKNSTYRLVILLVAAVMLVTGCTKTPDQGGATASPSASARPTGNTTAQSTFRPQQLPIDDEEDSTQTTGSVPITPTGEYAEINTLIPLKNANFDDVNDIAKTDWKRLGASVVMSISEDGFYGNCLYYTKDYDASASFHTPVIDIAPYITHGGDYTISFKFKLIGSDNVKSAFAGVIRTDSKTSFTPDRTNGSTYAGTGTSGPVEDDTWYQYTGGITVSADDIGKGGVWNLGLQSIQEGIEEIWLDEFEVHETVYSAEAVAVTEAVTWVANEVVLISDKEYNDPFTDVDVDLALTDGTTTYTIPGFWDGGNIWRVRFVCPTEGTWNYTTVCTDPSNTGLHGQKSTVICKKYVGNLPVYKHGFVKTEENTRYFTYNDGTPFFYLGDTHWALGSETYDMVREIVDTRAEMGYTVFQSEPIGASFNLVDGLTTADIAGFKSYDKKFKYIASYGLVHTNAAFFFPDKMSEFINNFGGFSKVVVAPDLHSTGRYDMYDLSDEAKSMLERYSRYWVARYSAYPVMWTLAQEVDNNYFWDLNDFKGHKEWSAVNNPYRLVAQYFGKYDPYNSPLSAHQEGSAYTKATNSAFRDIDAHTWYASQWKPEFTGETEKLNAAKDYWLNGQGKPTVNYEGLYCQLQTGQFGARAQGWMSYLSGMYGYGWGGQGTWYYQGSYRTDSDENDGVDVITAEEKTKPTWKDALQFESSVQVTYMRNFFENTVVEWNTLVPRFDDATYLQRDNGAYAVYASNEDNSKIVVYFYNFSDTSVADNPNSPTAGNKTGTFGKLTANATYNYVWFNPITGKTESTGTFTADANGSWAAGEKNTCDMVLYIYK